ncbi:MAG: hypothetical protein ABIA04_07660 [Pseudomonadota bacterium]
MDIYKDITKNILALSSSFEDYEFIHSYIGPKNIEHNASKISFKNAYRNLSSILYEINQSTTVVNLKHRETYFKDLLTSILTQADYFVNDYKNTSFKDTVEKLHGIKLIPKFNIEQELNKLNSHLYNLGYKNLEEFKNENRIVLFKNKNDLGNYVSKVISKYYEITSQKYSALFKLDLEKILSNSKIKIIESGPEDPTCYYHYDGNYQGTLGICIKSNLSDEFIKAFICHEVIPGHHLYYLIKQYQIDNSQIDLVGSIDTFYSPENMINEGLAVNSDLIFGDLLGSRVLITQKIEKFLHKLFYNMWYSKNIEEKEISRKYFDILKNDMLFSDALIKQRTDYFTEDDKFYTPSYPIGSYYVENLIKKHGLNILPYLYYQHSLDSILHLTN